MTVRIFTCSMTTWKNLKRRAMSIYFFWVTPMIRDKLLKCQQHTESSTLSFAQKLLEYLWQIILRQGKCCSMIVKGHKEQIKKVWAGCKRGPSLKFLCLFLNAPREHRTPPPEKESNNCLFFGLNSPPAQYHTLDSNTSTRRVLSTIKKYREADRPTQIGDCVSWKFLSFLDMISFKKVCYILNQNA